ncbi:unnamed protein product [Natator depressus]
MRHKITVLTSFHKCWVVSFRVLVKSLCSCWSPSSVVLVVPLWGRSATDVSQMENQIFFSPCCLLDFSLKMIPVRCNSLDIAEEKKPEEEKACTVLRELHFAE